MLTTANKTDNDNTMYQYFCDAQSCADGKTTRTNETMTTELQKLLVTNKVNTGAIGPATTNFRRIGNVRRHKPYTKRETLRTNFRIKLTSAKRFSFCKVSHMKRTKKAAANI
jgi:hypothetical protein